MMEKNGIYTGYVTRFYRDRNFGFLETNEGYSYFFKYDKAGIKLQKAQGILNYIHVFCSGDEVEFQLKPSGENHNTLEAFNLRFIKNERREELIKESLENDKLFGYLKLLDDERFFVKHATTYVFIPIEMSVWETNLQETYFNRIDEKVTFKLLRTNRISKMTAALTDVRYIDDYYELLSIMDNEITIPSIITGKNTIGLFVKILDGKYEGFILLSQNHKPLEPQILDKYKKGEILNVLIISILESKKLSFKIADDFM
jgi:hypothetical protein